MEIEITKTLPEDVEATWRVLDEAWLATYPNEEAGITKDDILHITQSWKSTEALEKTRSWLKNIPDNYRSFVARVHGQVVGLCVVVRHPDKNQIKSIYVLPDYQRLGIGKRLYEEAQKFFDPTKDSIVNVAVYNKQAINFYKKLGFADTGRRFFEERFRMKSGAVIPEMEMSIRITRAA